jgi:hypothetical protein
LNLKTFVSLDNPENYYIPSKGMGMDPSENEIWTDFNGIEHIKTCIEKNKSTMLAKNTKIRI